MTALPLINGFASGLRVPAKHVHNFGCTVDQRILRVHSGLCKV